MNVLVVDDEQIVLDSAERHLRHDGHNVIKVLSAEEGLDSIAKDSVHIVLTDLMMPEMDGLEFLKEIKDNHPAIPVIMITGYATINTALQAMQLGAFDYVAKPFTKAELCGVVERATNLVKASESSEEKVETSQNLEKENNLIFSKSLKGIGGHTWMMREKSGFVLIGVERSFLEMIGKIQTVDLPAKGEQLRQGSVCFQIFTSDLRSHVLWSPLSGSVVEINNTVLDNPDKALKDPYGEGWLLRIDPDNFEREAGLLGL